MSLQRLKGAPFLGEETDDGNLRLYDPIVEADQEPVLLGDVWQGDDSFYHFSPCDGVILSYRHLLCLTRYLGKLNDNRTRE